MKALLIINNSSRTGSRVRSEVEHHLHKNNIRFIAPDTENIELADIIRQHADAIDTIILGGGDGTLNYAAKSLIKYRKKLAIIPLGTANDLSRTLGIPEDIEEACQIIAKGQTQHINIGKVNGKYFFNVANIGFGVSVNRALDSSLKKWWGAFSYIIAAFRALRQQRPFYSEIRTSDKVLQTRVLQLAIGNGCFYGGGMRVHESADITDNVLHLYAISTRNLAGLSLNSLSFRKGELADIEGIEQLSSTEITVHTRKPKQIMADGEEISSTPAVFSLVPNALEVFAPAHTQK